ncbi:MAG: PilN domain-containing protein [Deltaproteobacteria bacterium]|nr:PilN domain-containing protein [Deltaproteobacteria bacterium]MBW1833641.1 PilN domain-containing protein [Deltaproteobacteria bacterium]
MKPIKVNISTLEYHDKRIVYSVVLGAIVFLAVIIGYNINVGVKYQKEISEYEEKIGKLVEQNQSKRKFLHKELKEEEIKQIKTDALFVNKLIAIDIFPWDHLLETLEDNIPEGIILMNLSLSDIYDKLLLKGSAGSIEKIALFLKKLEESSMFQKCMILKLSVEKGSLEEISKKKPFNIYFEIEISLLMNEIFPEDKYGNLSTALVQLAE